MYPTATTSDPTTSKFQPPPHRTRRANLCKIQAHRTRRARVFFSFIINGCMRRRTYSHALKNTQPRFELAHRLTPSAGGARLRTRGFGPRFYPAFANKPTDTTNKPPRKVQPYATVYKYVRPPASRVPLLPIGTAPTAQRLRCSFPYATVQLPFSLRLLPTNQQATTQGATVCNRI